MHSAEQAPIRVGVVGATGYAGVELVRLLGRHSGAQLRLAMASGDRTTEASPRLRGLWDQPVAGLSVERLVDDVQAVFLALPETVAADVGPRLLAGGVRVFDLSGAFRLHDDEVRRDWYPATSSEAAAQAVYGLTEHHRHALGTARLIACPGCYPTAALLALRPLADAGLLEGDIIIDAKSGISGAGKSPSERTHFSECHGNVAAYGALGHRHALEIEQELGRPVIFVPHLVPLDRGILETIYVTLTAGADETTVAQAFESSYRHAPFVRLTGDRLPEIKHVAHTNFCDIGWAYRPASRRLIVVSCIDNLLKGAAGQAVQNFNVAYGFEERAGLD